MDFFKKTYQNSYKFSPSTSFEFVVPPKDIIFGKGIPVPAKAIEIEILNLDKSGQVQLAEQSKYTYASAEELKGLLQEMGAFYLRGQRFYINTSTGRFLVQIKKTFAGNLVECDKKQNWKQPMAVDENTEITFKVNSPEKIILVDDNKPVDVKSITFKVAKGGEAGDEGLSLFLKMLGGHGDKTPVETTSILEKDLLAASAESLKKPVVLKKPFKVRMKDGTKYKLTPDKIEYDTKEPATIKHALLSRIVDKSKVLFESEGKDLVVINNNSEAVCKNPPKSLEELGLGGLAEEFLKIVRLVIMSRGNLKQEMEKRGVKPAKGLLLSGPPGTGKTTLARHIGRLLGCPEERVIMITGTEVFNKWVGGSEENVRKLFAPAREADAKLKEKSPLFVVVIDEIEAMVPKRNSDGNNKWRDTVVNQFLGELDGLKQLSNVLVIGMTNLPENLDPAVLRPGRMDVHIKFGLPKYEGRIEIFNIHTSKLRENKLLTPDVDFKALSKKTDGFSGADIQGLVQRAVSFSIERLSKLSMDKPEMTAEEFAKAPEGLLTMSDFERALEEMKKKDDKDESWKTLCPMLYT
jgi:SpoVK/Ycf46/Vps4 family AAA+-type ATPase